MHSSRTGGYRGAPMVELPDWPPGTVAVLATGGGAPHAIPVSTAVPAGDAVLLALAQSRESLARLRAEPRCALVVLAAGDVAVTLHGRAEVVGEVAGAAAVRLAVERVQDHDQPTFAIEAGVRWRWTDPAAERRDAEVRAGLLALAAPGDADSE
jgi:nitroimidazol reductase NimA-like FMN-containing flavoprotein (pyridoxamine 5'-phosphate oxidase superfamily)